MTNTLASATIEALHDLLASPGWTVFARELEARKALHLKSLTQETSTRDLPDVRSLQARINEIDVLLRWPEQEIERARRATLARAGE